MKIAYALITATLLTSAQGFAMPSQTRRVALWKGGEEIAGEEFIAATESVVDYLATLPRPAAGFETYRYNCSVKARFIRPTVQLTPLSSTYGDVLISMVYELKDCVAAK